MTNQFEDERTGEIGVDKYELEPAPIIAQDFLGKEIAVGDRVIYCELGYREFEFSTIMRITPKMVFLDKANRPDKLRWVKQAHYQVIKSYE